MRRMKKKKIKEESREREREKRRKEDGYNGGFKPSGFERLKSVWNNKREEIKEVTRRNKGRRKDGVKSYKNQ